MLEYQEEDLHIRKLREEKGLTFAEIGDRLGISRQAAWQAYQRATRPERARKRKRRPHSYQG